MTIYAEKRSGRTTGRWIIEVDISGKRKRARAANYEEARVAEGLLMSGQAVPEPNKDNDLRWLQAQSNVIWGGCKDDQQAKRLEVCVNLIGPEALIKNVTTSRLHKLKIDLAALPATKASHRPIRDPKTLHRYLSAMSKALTWAKRQGVISSTPDIPWPKAEVAPKRFFTVDEEDAVCSWFVTRGDPDKALIIRVLAQTGLRIGELLKLRLENVTDGYVLVGDYAGGTKTGDHRYVPISEALAAPLAALLARGLPSYRGLLTALHGACEATGVDRRKTLHKLRHTTATRLMKAGVNAFVIKDYLGHKRLETTLGYASVERADLKKASEVLTTDGTVFPGAGYVRGKSAAKRQMPAANPLKAGGLARNRTGVQGFAETNDLPVAPLAQTDNTPGEGPRLTETPVDTSWIDLAEEG